MAYDITFLGTRNEFFSSGNKPSSACRLTDTRIVACYSDNVNDGWVRAFDVDRSTGAFTGLSSAIEFDASQAKQMKMLRVDDTHFIIAWQDIDSDGKVCLFSVDAGTGAITQGTPLEFDTTFASYMALELLDSTHFLLTWQNTSTGGNGSARAYSMNTGAGTISALGSAHQFATARYAFSTAKIAGYSYKVAVFYAGTTTEDLYGIVLDVDGSWNVTSAGSEATLKTGTVNSPAVDYIYTTGSNAVLAAIYHDGSQKVRTFNVNTSTWALTTRGAELSHGGGLNIISSLHIHRVDDSHVVVLSNNASSNQPSGKTYSIDGTSGDLTQLDDTVFGASSTDTPQYIEIHDMSSNKFLASWWSDTDDGALLHLFEISVAVDVSVSIGTPPSITMTTQAPSLSGGANVSQGTPPSAIFSTPAPALSGGASVASSVLSATFSIPLVDVYTPDALVSPSALTATFDAPDPTVVGEANVSQGTPLSATFSIPTPAVAIGASISAGVLTATFTLQTPVVTAEQSVTASAGILSATFSLPTSAVEIGQMVEPSPLTATFSIPAFTVTAERFVTVSASVLVATFSLVRPRKMGGAWSPQPREVGDWTAQPRTMG